MRDTDDGMLAELLLDQPLHQSVCVPIHATGRFVHNQNSTRILILPYDCSGEAKQLLLSVRERLVDKDSVETAATFKRGPNPNPSQDGCDFLVG